MNLEYLAFGWREALIGAVVLLALYALVVYRRLHRLKRQAAVPQNPVQKTEESLTEAAVEVASPAVAAYVEASFPWNEPPDPADPGETAALAENRLRAAEAEITALRSEVAALSGEIATLREEVRLQVERVQASHNVAPIYGDAMQMAVAGYDAAAIAERCGVARAEAELVVALIRNRDNAEPSMRER